jgi:SAM-dependent methyltransferase
MNAELERIRTEYLKRDAAGSTNPYSYANPAFQYHIQEREHGLLQMLRRLKLDLAATDVLEVGCGTGHILGRFLEFGARSVAGVELMPHRILMGRDKYPTIRTLCADAGDLPFASESFGLVMQFMCLSSVLDSSLRVRIAQEMWRVLAPGGVILSYDLRPGSVLRNSIGYLAAQSRNGSGSKMVSDKGNHVVTPTRPVGIEELGSLFSEGTLISRSLSLDFNLASLAGLSWLLTSVLSAVPALRTHWLAVIRKPAKKV